MIKILYCYESHINTNGIKMKKDNIPDNVVQLPLKKVPRPVNIRTSKLNPATTVDKKAARTNLVGAGGYGRLVRDEAVDDNNWTRLGLWLGRGFIISAIVVSVVIIAYSLLD